MKMLVKFKKAYADWSSEMKGKVVDFIIDSGKDGDA